MPLQKKRKMLPSPERRRRQDTRNQKRQEERQQELTRQGNNRAFDARQISSRFKGARISSKEAKSYNRVLSADPNFTGLVRERPFKGAKISIEDNGNVKRNRNHWFRPDTEKVERWEKDPNDPSKVVRQLVSLKTQSRTTTRTRQFDSGNELKGHSKIRKDGRYKEVWERDKTGKLVLTDYHTARGRDIGFSAPINQYLVRDKKGKVAIDDFGYRTMVREQGKRTERYRMDDDGNLTLVKRKSRTSSMSLNEDSDGSFSSRDKSRNFGWLYSKKYRTALDDDDKNSSNSSRKPMLSRQVLWDRRQNFVDENGLLTGRKHNFSFAFSKSTEFKNDNLKFVKKKLFGITISGRKPKDLSASDRKDMADFRAAARKSVRSSVSSSEIEKDRIDSEKTKTRNSSDRFARVSDTDKSASTLASGEQTAQKGRLDISDTDSGSDSDGKKSDGYENGIRKDPFLKTKPLRIVSSKKDAGSSKEESVRTSRVVPLKDRRAMREHDRTSSGSDTENAWKISPLRSPKMSGHLQSSDHSSSSSESDPDPFAKSQAAHLARKTNEIRCTDIETSNGSQRSSSPTGNDIQKKGLSILGKALPISSRDSDHYSSESDPDPFATSKAAHQARLGIMNRPNERQARGQ